ncbi:sulfotransferase [Promineifilum sp.]|uniref:sulfotransferase family protein n=1 Tax=Promineifilum sp. TaxID=2664178 RepID=UPI0035B04982
MDNNHLPDAPIYIGGLERSGKTYMRLMLAAHPEVVFSKRTRLWTRIYDHWGDLADPANFERCLNAMRQNKHVRALEPDVERLRREFYAIVGAGFKSAPTSDTAAYALLFALVHRHYAERLGKTRWGDQTESVENYAKEILAIFPAARIVHLLRDPRDWYEAIVARDGRRPGRLGDAAERWSRSADLALRHQRRYPDRYKVVRYETLAAHPEETLRDVSAFVGLEMTPDMLALGHAARFQDSETRHSPLSTAYIGRFRQRLAAHEWGYLQDQTAARMAAFGYDLEPVHLSLADRLRCRAVMPTTSLTRLIRG